MKTIGFEAGAIHGQVSELAAVRGELRLGVPSLVVRGEIPRHRGAIGRHNVHVEVGRPRFSAAGASWERYLAAVGTEAVVLAAAEGLAGYIADAAGEVCRRSLRDAAVIESHGKHLRLAA